MGSTILNMNITDITNSQNQPIMPSGVVGYWSCNDYSGNKLKDYSGNNNDGTITGCTFGVGKRAGALSFSGLLGTNYVDCGTATDCNFTTSDFTIMFWANPATLNVSTAGNKDFCSVFMGNGSYQEKGWYMQVPGAPSNGSAIIFVTNQNTAHQFICSNNGYLTVNTWQHIAVVRNGTVGRIYYNGAEVSYLTQDAITSPTSATYNLLFGKYPADNNNYWYNGLLDDITMYNKALSASDILTIYNGTK